MLISLNNLDYNIDHFVNINDLINNQVDPRSFNSFLNLFLNKTNYSPSYIVKKNIINPSCLTYNTFDNKSNINM